jgi:ABC-2 type transport system ATP-binding protein
LISLVTRLYHARRGDIRVFGHSLREKPSAALAAIGVVFQQPTLDLDLTVRQNLRYHASLYGLSSREADARIGDELARLGVADLISGKVRVLSGGQRRRVEIARALLHSPRLLILDEPTVGLDAASRHAILAHVRSLCRERGLAALWATHLMDEVEDADEVVILHDGEVLRTGPACEISRSLDVGGIGEAFLKLAKVAA